jgi:hypothetical protein
MDPTTECRLSMKEPPAAGRLFDQFRPSVPARDTEFRPGRAKNSGE